MKKIILTVAAVFAFGFANAQDMEAPSFGFSKGNIFVEGNLGLTTINDKNFDYKATGFEFNPKAGYFVTDDLAVGLSLGLGTIKETESGSDVTKYTIYDIGVFGRYYFLNLGERFKTFTEAGLTIGGEEEKISGYKSTNFGAGLGLGMNYFVTPKIAITFNLSDILSFSSSEVDGAETVTEFNANLNVFNNFFATPSFGALYKF